MTVQLKRVTTEYIPEEDRIRMNGLTPEGTVSIWLTQRLCNIMVLNLISWLQKTLPEYKETGKHRATATQEYSHSFAQQSANLSYQQGPVEKHVIPDEVTNRHTTWLAFSISMRSSPQAICISISDQTEEQTTEFCMEAEKLRQWLNIIYKSYRQACWAETVWPEWIREPSDSTVPVNHPVH